MRFTDIFIQRPVLAIVVSCLLLMLGLQGASQLSVRQFPDVEKSLIFVTAAYPGASARTVQGFVTDPLQRRIAGKHAAKLGGRRGSGQKCRVSVQVYQPEG